jgi:hypothetical protein
METNAAFVVNGVAFTPEMHFMIDFLQAPQMVKSELTFTNMGVDMEVKRIEPLQLYLIDKLSENTEDEPQLVEFIKVLHNVRWILMQFAAPVK